MNTIIYAKESEKFVKRVILYLNGEDNVLYYDKEFENGVPAEDLKNLFIKGLIAITSAEENTFLVPTKFGVQDEAAYVSAIIVGDEAEEIKGYSKGYSVEG